ncbi:hypothetical protein ACSDR0_47265 [Streptosporangium sp. G11]|uniref:hypothetical protein n=1 Tax=Streptosporangium sp. G11 TaxID=3436926 RepID=UPI003EBC93D3
MRASAEPVIRLARNLWQENDLAFAGKHGTELDAANVRRAFRVMLKRTDPNEDEWTPPGLGSSLYAGIWQWGYQDLNLGPLPCQDQVTPDQGLAIRIWAVLDECGRELVCASVAVLVAVPMFHDPVRMQNDPKTR